MNIEEIKAACREAIALGEKATEGPWVWRKGRTQMHLHSCGRPDAGCFSQITMPIPALQKEYREVYEANAGVILHSRQFTPSAAKALLNTIEELERMRDEFQNPSPGAHIAGRILNQICAEWKNE